MLTLPPLLPLLDLYISLNLAFDTLILKMATALYGETAKDFQCIIWLNLISLKHILGTGIKNLRTRIFLCISDFFAFGTIYPFHIGVFNHLTFH
jgi:hypothetical protein